MPESSQKSSIKQPGAGGRSKVKTGCRTCKIRKVKCDEARPSCQRCVSTGRVCDGYGIWGGGGNAYTQQGTDLKQHSGSAVRQYHADLGRPSPAPMGVATADEQGYFEWFTCRTSRKLPGPYQSPFWHTLLFQASAMEPAIFHALLALSCAHQTDKHMLVRHSGRSKVDIPDPKEQFTLRQYSKAIRLLNDRISVKDSLPVPVTLITCLIFVIMEFFRGNFTSGNTHLRNGFRLLREVFPDANSVLEINLAAPTGWRSISYDILEMFAKLRVQTELFGQYCPEAMLIQIIPEDELPIRLFCSATQARQWIDWLLQKILHLTTRCRKEMGTLDAACHPGLLESQRRVKAELASWIDAYEASTDALLKGGTTIDALGYLMVAKYHTMAEIMVGTCLMPTCESAFDSFTNHFVTIVMQSIEGRKAAMSPPVQRILSDKDEGMSKGIADIAWIPPLYYTALKCRVHRVRLHAIKLLDLTSHMEGIWSARLAALIGREIMRIEERGFYRELETSDDFSPTAPLDNLDLSLPTLPESYRIHDVRVVLPDYAAGNLILEYQQRQDDGNLQASAREYDFDSQRWRNMKRINRKT